MNINLPDNVCFSFDIEGENFDHINVLNSCIGVTTTNNTLPTQMNSGLSESTYLPILQEVRSNISRDDESIIGSGNGRFHSKFLLLTSGQENDETINYYSIRFHYRSYNDREPFFITLSLYTIEPTDNLYTRLISSPYPFDEIFQINELQFCSPNFLPRYVSSVPTFVGHTHETIVEQDDLLRCHIRDDSSSGLQVRWSINAFADHYFQNPTLTNFGSSIHNDRNRLVGFEIVPIIPMGHTMEEDDSDMPELIYNTAYRVSEIDEMVWSERLFVKDHHNEYFIIHQPSLNELKSELWFYSDEDLGKFISNLWKRRVATNTNADICLFVGKTMPSQ